MNNLVKPRHILVTGGVRSGKSRFAEEQAKNAGGRVVYLATAEVRDEEMAERINRHRQQRPPEWLTVEAPLDIAAPLFKYQTGYTVLLDCLTMYLSNLYFFYESKSSPPDLEGVVLEKIRELASIIQRSNANLVIVTNEVGWGIVPENYVARVFRDLSGMANQYIAEVCNEVYLLTCGIPMKIKGENDVTQI